VQVQRSNDPSGLPPTQAPALLPTGNLENWEVCLDIEMAMAMAPGAQVIVFEGSNGDSILTNMTNNAGVGQFSSSFTGGVSALTPVLLTTLAAQGQTFIAASGDWGAYEPSGPTCPLANQQAIDNGTLPRTEGSPRDWRAMPFVTVVGGTTLSTTAGAWSGEVTWPGSGGGIVEGVDLPDYQLGLNAMNPELSSSKRNLPDLSLVAQGLYIVTSNCNGADPLGLTGQKVNDVVIAPCPAAQLTGGVQRQVGGTSAASPLFAGMMALVNQQSALLGKGRIGWANPVLYGIGRDPARYANTFRDIGAAGSETAPNSCAFTYHSHAGYDLTTGWGSPKCALIGELAGLPTLRHVDIDGRLIELAQDVDSCPTCNSLLSNQPIDLHMTLSPDAPNDSKVFERCVDNDVKVRVKFSASLSASDFSTVHICVSQGLFHSYGAFSPNACDETVTLSAQVCADLAPGASTSFGSGLTLTSDISDSHAHAIWNAGIANN